MTVGFLLATGKAAAQRKVLVETQDTLELCEEWRSNQTTRHAVLQDMFADIEEKYAHEKRERARFEASHENHKVALDAAEECLDDKLKMERVLNELKKSMAYAEGSPFAFAVGRKMRQLSESFEKYIAYESPRRFR